MLSKCASLNFTVHATPDNKWYHSVWVFHSEKDFYEWTQLSKSNIPFLDTKSLGYRKISTINCIKCVIRSMFGSNTTDQRTKLFSIYFIHIPPTFEPTNTCEIFVYVENLELSYNLIVSKNIVPSHFESDTKMNEFVGVNIYVKRNLLYSIVANDWLNRNRRLHDRN